MAGVRFHSGKTLKEETMTASVPGYTFGTSQAAKSPIGPDDFDLLKRTVLLDEEDLRYLRMSADVLRDQVEEILDVWYGFVAANPHLLHFFTGVNDGQPIGPYLEAVRKRFGRWILDTAAAAYDQAWLDYQHEIGLRHHRAKKNQTDAVASVPHINYRYLPTLVYPITATLKPFLARKGHSSDEVERMHQAWLKSVLLQVTLWSWPYVREGDF
jgi:hypothetical protein